MKFYNMGGESKKFNIEKKIQWGIGWVMSREGQRGRYLECCGHYLESLWRISRPTNQMGSLECQYLASANTMQSLAPQKFLVG